MSNGVCFKNNVMYRILGDGLDPLHITSVLGIAPTVAYAKGDKYEIPRVGFRHRSTGLWSLCSELYVKEQDVCKHVKYIIENINPCKLFEVRKEVDLKFTISIWVEFSEEHGGMIIPSKLLKDACNLCDDVQFHFLTHM